MYGDQRPKKTSPFMVITLIAEQNFGSANKADRQPIPSHEGATSSERCLSGAEWPELGPSGAHFGRHQRLMLTSPASGAISSAPKYRKGRHGP